MLKVVFLFFESIITSISLRLFSISKAIRGRLWNILFIFKNIFAILWLFEHSFRILRIVLIKILIIISLKLLKDIKVD